MTVMLSNLLQHATVSVQIAVVIKHNTRENKAILEVISIAQLSGDKWTIEKKNKTILDFVALWLVSLTFFKALKRRAHFYFLTLQCIYYIFM